MENKPIITRTKEGLALVTKETRDAFSKSLEIEVLIREYPTSMVQEWVNELWKKNPEVMKYAVGVVNRFSPELRGVILASILSLYELLESQELNNKIKEYFGIQDKNYHT